MEIQKLTLAEMQILYRNRMTRDFPPSELRPFESLRTLWEKGQYRCYAFMEEGKILAYAAFAAQGDALLLDYFAVERDLRGQGIGSRFLQALRGLSADHSASYFLIEVESLESASTEEERKARSRRISFYERCGCAASNIYSLLFGVEYRILALPLRETIPSDEEIRLGLSTVYETLLSSLPLRTEERDRVCRVSPGGSFSKASAEAAG